MNENVTADDRVEPAGRLPRMSVGLDTADVIHPFSGRATTALAIIDPTRYSTISNASAA
jgi:hypothetical protein